MCTLSRHSEAAYTEDDFFGVTMYWSNYGLENYTDILTGLGFSLLETSTIDDGYSKSHDVPREDHPLVFARRR